MELDGLRVEMREDNRLAGPSGPIRIEGDVSARAVIDDRRRALLGGLAAGAQNEVIVHSGPVHQLSIAVVDRRAVVEDAEDRAVQDDLVDADLEVGDVVRVTRCQGRIEDELVRTRSTGQEIMTGPTGNHIVASATIDRVAAGTATQAVHAAVTDEDIVAVIAGAADVGRPFEVEVLEIDAERPGHGRVDVVDTAALAVELDDFILAVIHILGVIASTAFKTTVLVLRGVQCIVTIGAAGGVSESHTQISFPKSLYGTDYGILRSRENDSPQQVRPAL